MDLWHFVDTAWVQHQRDLPSAEGVVSCETYPRVDPGASHGEAEAAANESGRSIGFSWSERKSVKGSGGQCAPAELHCTTSKIVREILIINEILAEAAGVELSRVLRTRKLLILGTATRAKKAPHCPIHCTFIVRKRFSLCYLENTHLVDSLP
jgi:hypothetical protein